MHVIYYLFPLLVITQILMRNTNMSSIKCSLNQQIMVVGKCEHVKILCTLSLPYWVIRMKSLLESICYGNTASEMWLSTLLHVPVEQFSFWFDWQHECESKEQSRVFFFSNFHGRGHIFQAALKTAHPRLKPHAMIPAHTSSHKTVIQTAAYPPV